MADGLPVEVALIIPRYSDDWGEPVVVRLGARDSVTARPGPLLRAVLTSGAEAFVLAHTHVSRQSPGEDDTAVTRRVVAAAAVVGVELLGHVVVGPDAVWQCDAEGGWAVAQAVPSTGR
ncbi:MAG: JAB domain-containing protein [Actinomycetales bacterium]